ncbi:MAG: flippase activity-associated protein Agl23 [Roseimicrobium sp.]
MAREPKPIRWKTLLVLLAMALTLGSLFRFTDLGKKPMHTDEAILALKTQEYWQTGNFEYDPKDYHGPFLHHAAVWLGGLRGMTPENLTEEQVRWVVCVFGLLLILSPLLLTDVLGRTGAGVAALLIAVSPMMNYYSRYYIMEVPFVLQTIVFIASVWRWSQSKNIAWLFLAGIMLGWMHATKETFVLNIAALAAGYGVVKVMGLPFTAKERGYGFRSFTKAPISLQPWLIVSLVALLVSAWLYSNGFKTWNQIGDSVLTYRSYLQRSGGSGHEQSWHYYISLLAWRQQGFLWSEGLISGLGLVGILNAFLDRRRADHKRAFLTLFATYTLVLLGIYCFIPYKTPWSILGVQHALTLLAGLGARSIFRVFTEVPLVKIALALLLGGGIYNLCEQTSRATDFRFEHETRYAASQMHNPYVYSHTSPNLVTLAGRIHELAEHTDEKLNMPVQVIQSENGWPLPWYLRDMKMVGYQSTMPQVLQAPVVVVDAGLEEAAREKLGGNYESSVYGLRQGIVLSLLVERSLWEKFQGLPPSTPPPVAAAANTTTSTPASPSTVGTPVPVTGPPGEAATTPGGVVPPKAQVVEDDGPPPFVGPPYPVPIVEPSPESRRSRRRS